MTLRLRTLPLFWVNLWLGSMLDATNLSAWILALYPVGLASLVPQLLEKQSIQFLTSVAFV
jgi:hypothetical protein